MLEHKLESRNISGSILLVVNILIPPDSLGNAGTSVYYSLNMKSQATVSLPPVILQNGNVSGASTIYMNSTSAKVNVTATQGMTIKRVQGNARGGTSSSVSGTLASTPLADNVLVAVIETYCMVTAPFASINRTGVSWSKQISKSGYSGTIDIEIWFGVVSSAAIT
jgi:hypothetical protein